VAFDQDRLYVYVRARDPHPDSIMRALTRRDVRGPSDQIGVIVDSYNDRRSGLEFYVNPDGVKRDLAIYNDVQEDRPLRRMSGRLRQPTLGCYALRSQGPMIARVRP
jgi:hypothetical protein